MNNKSKILNTILSKFGLALLTRVSKIEKKYKDIIDTLRNQRNKQKEIIDTLRNQRNKQKNIINKLRNKYNTQKDTNDTLNTKLYKQRIIDDQLKTEINILKKHMVSIGDKSFFNQQVSNFSHLKRHEMILNKLKTHLDNIGLKTNKILSFGCSNGSECIDISQIFTNSKIYGCDINHSILDEAKKNVSDEIDIFYSSPEQMDEKGPFDLILIFNVLCNYPATLGQNNISTLYSFDSFDNILSSLDTHILSKGALVIYNSSYFFEDAAISQKYTSSDIGISSNGWIEKSLKNGKRICNLLCEYKGQTYSRDKCMELNKTLKENNQPELFENIVTKKLKLIGNNSFDKSLTNILWIKK